MKCKHCGQQDGIKYSNYASGEFCSRRCAKQYAARYNRIETNKKISKSLMGRPGRRSLHFIQKQCPVCQTKFKVLPSKNTRRFCSKKCYLVACKKHMMNQGCGGYREGSNRWRGEYCSNIAGITFWMDSSWEARLARVLNNSGILWVKNYRQFPYFFNDKKFNYIPDFYLPGLDIWIEVKGWLKEKDVAKMNGFPHHLLLVRKAELKELEEITPR